MAKFITCHRRGTASQWEEKNTIIPYEGEIVIEIDEENFLHKLKIGDGIHTYAQLNYLQAGDEIVTQVLNKAIPRVVTVTLSASGWTEVASEINSDLRYYSQTVSLDGITSQSRLDLQPNADMIAEFKQLGLIFVTENKEKVITVYSVGNMPSRSYTMQATIVETELKADNEEVVGIPVGTSAVQADWNQTDETKADYIKNKPTRVTGAVYGWSYTEGESSLGTFENPDTLGLIIYAFNFMPEVVISDISVINLDMNAFLPYEYFEIYAICETDGGGYIEWITGSGELVSYPLTTEYQFFSSNETSTFSIRCTSTVVLSPIADQSQVGLVSTSELSKVHNDIYKITTDKADVNHVHPFVSIETNTDGFMSVIDKRKLDAIETIYATKEELDEKLGGTSIDVKIDNGVLILSKTII